MRTALDKGVGMRGIPGSLVLENGAIFPGYLFGEPVSASSIRQAKLKKGSQKDLGYGEVVFNTSMTGYQEILTDPSYYGQIVCLTAPHIGNTGINPEDVESARPLCSGLIVHELCHTPSHWKSNGSLAQYLEKNRISGIHGVDTRALTRLLRSRGVVRGVLLPEEDLAEAEGLLAELPPFEGRDLIREVTTPEPYFWSESQGEPKYRVVALDFGIKWNLLRNLQKLGCEVHVVPAHSSAEEILARKPHGVFLSNGPGDPSAAPYAVQTVRELLGKVPIFGVCMGHHMLALALGAKTYKLKFGHRGGNQPVLCKTTGRVEISSHNHGYAVEALSLPPSAEVTHVNLNDKTVEGLVVKDLNAFSVQYHPEACPGPHDSVELFHQFIQKMEHYVSKVS